MLKIHTLTLGALQTNIYIVHNHDSQKCVIIDPGYEPQVILDTLETLELEADAILLTHGHFDHVGAVEAIVRATGCALWMHKGDYNHRKNPMNDYLYPLHDRCLGEISFCEDGTEIQAGGLSFTVFSTPGHSRGSVCYRCGDTLFSGDTLFAEGCGRTDLPGGNPDAIFVSLACLAELEDDLAVFPGHGESTTLAREKRYNPYLR